MADAAGTVACVRCGRPDAPVLRKAPLPGANGAEILAKVCADCWADWLKAEVMVINELRLNFMDPSAQEILNQQMRQFLQLEPGGGAGPSTLRPVR